MNRRPGKASIALLCGLGIVLGVALALPTMAAAQASACSNPSATRDADRDGLSDRRECQLGTLVNNRDTDGDGLTDGDEVNRYFTNPKNADHDGDGLSDGDEVTTRRTDPRKRDTDGDGIFDGSDNAPNDPCLVVGRAGDAACDTTPPETRIVAQPPNPSASATATFQFMGTDAFTVTGFQCRLDGGRFGACLSPQTYTSLTDGSHRFEVRAVDQRGNSDPTPASTTWTVDATAPTVTINQASTQADPATGTPIGFDIVFSETVSSFATGDVTLSGTAGATTAAVSGSDTTYTVSVTGMTTSGTVSASIGAGVATDAAGNGNSASTSTDNSVTFCLIPNPIPNGDSAALIAAIACANGTTANETIALAAGGTYNVSSAHNTTGGAGGNGLPAIVSAATAGTLTIAGNGASIGGGGGSSNYRAFYVAGGGNLTLDGLTVRNFRTTNSGGGLRNDSGTVTLTNTTVSGNTAGNGGGLVNVSGTVRLTNTTVSRNTASSFGGGGLYAFGGTLTLTNTTVSGNSAANSGGGLYNIGGTVTLTNTTVSENSAGSNGGGVTNSGATVTLRNTIVTGNSASRSGPDLSGTFSGSSAHNLIGTMAGSSGITIGVNGNVTQAASGALGTLTGSPAYYPLAAGSLALDAGDNSFVSESSTGIDYNGDGDTRDTLTTDQRGLTRTVNGNGTGGAEVDIGAFEKQDTG